MLIFVVNFYFNFFLFRLKRIFIQYYLSKTINIIVNIIHRIKKENKFLKNNLTLSKIWSHNYCNYKRINNEIHTKVGWIWLYIDIKIIFICAFQQFLFQLQKIIKKYIKIKNGKIIIHFFLRIKLMQNKKPNKILY